MKSLGRFRSSKGKVSHAVAYNVVDIKKIINVPLAKHTVHKKTVGLLSQMKSRGIQDSNYTE